MILHWPRATTCISVAFASLLYLIVSEPVNLSRPCPNVQGDADVQRGGNAGRNFISCPEVMAGNHEEIQKASGHHWCRSSISISPKDYLSLAQNCTTFRYHRQYNRTKVTAEETAFPLAFSIVMHESVEQTERLLRLIYRPQNFYCIHVDLKANKVIHQAITAISSCLENVFTILNPVSVAWAEFTVLEAEILCLRELLKFAGWKYYMNINGREFPLKTNWELVQILKTYNGSNDIDGTFYRRPISWTKYVWRKEYWRTNQLKSPPPRGFMVAKGSQHVAACRGFVDFALNNDRSRDLLEWMRDVRVPDEHFYATLNHNFILGVPGAYSGDPDSKGAFYARLKTWQEPGVACHGRWSRYICQLGVGDLHTLVTAKHLFVNKLHLELDPVAFSCAEWWYLNRVAHQHDVTLDLKFYANLDFVKHHV